MYSATKGNSVFQNYIKIAVTTAKRRQSDCALRNNRLNAFREIIAVYCDILRVINSQRKQGAEFCFNTVAGGISFKPVVFKLFCSRTPTYNFSSTLYPPKMLMHNSSYTYSIIYI
jgi:hypothetical protein